MEAAKCSLLEERKCNTHKRKEWKIGNKNNQAHMLRIQITQLVKKLKHVNYERTTHNLLQSLHKNKFNTPHDNHFITLLQDLELQVLK